MEGEVWKANRHRMGHSGKMMKELLTFVKEEGVVFPRDVAARFGVSIMGARYRLKVALQAKLVEGKKYGEVLEVDGKRWTVDKLVAGDVELRLAPGGARFLQQGAAA